MTTDTHPTHSSRDSAECAEQPAGLCALRDRHSVSRDLFSVPEIAHLSFLRWLVQTGRLTL